MFFSFFVGAEAPKPDSKVMLTVSPHGILTLGFIFMISSPEFFDSSIKWLVAEMLLKLPFICDFLRWSDTWDCTKNRMNKFMKKGHNVALIPGGFQEATLYERNRHKLFLNDRKGFIKYALKFGYKIVPCYVFGEELSYWQWEIGFKSFRLWLNKHNIPGIFFIGKYLFLPDNDINVISVVGKPIELPHILNPKSSDIDKYHKIYMDEIKGLFDRNKGKYAAQKDAKLEFV